MSPIKPPYFTFPDIVAQEDLSFEKLSSNNFEQLYLMFEGDENLFTDDRFKHYDKAREYAIYLEQYGTCLPKHGGQDWLFLWKKEYAGVLHLYDLSLESFAENNRRCWIGFATKPALRNKGITKQALHYFIHYIFDNYLFIKYVHSMTSKENIAAKSLLQSVGFREDEEERMSNEHIFYLLKKK